MTVYNLSLNLDGSISGHFSWQKGQDNNPDVYTYIGGNFTQNALTLADGKLVDASFPALMSVSAKPFSNSWYWSDSNLWPFSYVAITAAVAEFDLIDGLSPFNAVKHFFDFAQTLVEFGPTKQSFSVPVFDLLLGDGWTSHLFPISISIDIIYH